MPEDLGKERELRRLELDLRTAKELLVRAAIELEDCVCNGEGPKDVSEQIEKFLTGVAQSGSASGS